MLPKLERYLYGAADNRLEVVRLLLKSLRLERFSASTGVPWLNRNFVHPTLLAVPPTDEQNWIVAAAEAQDERLRVECQYLAKLKACKKGLMQDLLSGRVRVPAEVAG